MAVAAVAAAPAHASGPAVSGQGVLTVNCAGVGQFQVRTQNNNHSNGVGQIIGMKGHGIPVRFTFWLVDETTGQRIFIGTNATGNGHGHPNQTTTPCSFTLFEGIAGQVLNPLPPGVAPTDTVRGEAVVDVVLKL
jgi:hypothetical protein